jgi:hypothetical protein
VDIKRLGVVKMGEIFSVTINAVMVDNLNQNE